jgi:vacuolar-type H+-ATPase subunit H
LLRLAEEQRDQIITEAHNEAAWIVDEARDEAGKYRRMPGYKQASSLTAL